MWRREAFLKAFRDLVDFRGDSKFSTWLVSIALNEAQKRLQRLGVICMESLDEPAEDGTTVSPPL
jgi:RNA polymerase sigma-70 factor (ECF subfamily)